MQRRKTISPKPKAPRVPADTVFTYKNIDILTKFISPQGYIIGRANSSLTQKQQRRLASAIKYARHLALLPFTQTL